ncbi:MAG: CPBP family intramembrane metalloprotease [Bacteroidales bacterium]|nr:CPBP family intramembrane metalloprotease [Bacteroidales bacterium]
MFRNLKYFLPSFNQSLLIVLLLIIAGGIGMGVLLAVCYGAAGIAMADINPLVMYLCQFVPPFIYILYKGSDTVKENGRLIEKGLFDRIVKPVPFNTYTFGNISSPVVFLLVFVATLALMVALEPLNSIVPMPDSVKQIYANMLSNMVWTSLSVAVAAPLAEEFLLRGTILRGMLYHSTPLKAILWSAFYFALIHMNLYQALGAFLMGLFIGWIYYKTGTLWLAVLIHFVNNGSSVLFTVLNPEIDVETTLMDIITDSWGIEAYIAIFTLSVAVFVAILYYFHKNLDNGKIKKNISA